MASFEGVPEGFEFVGIRRACTGDWYITPVGRSRQWKGPDSDSVYPILHKIEAPKQYRAFASKAEFALHRDRWVVSEIGKNDNEFTTCRACGYDHSGIYVGGSFAKDYILFTDLFEHFVFDNLDGTFEPCGVEVTE